MRTQTVGFTYLQFAEWLLFIVKTQNAAVLIQKTTEGAVVEIFEISAFNRGVMQAEHGLLRDLPAQSIRISSEHWNKVAFRDSLAYALHMLSTDQPDCSKATATKAQCAVNEERDTGHPKLVTQLLFSFLECYGKSTRRQAISKKIRDNVVRGSTTRPWRRSSTHLATKISLHLMLSASLSLGSIATFKNLMLYLHAQIGSDITKTRVLSAHDLHIIRSKIAYRAAKLGENTLPDLQIHLTSTIEAISDYISHGWRFIRDQETQLLPCIRAGQKKVDKYLALSDSANSLLRSMERYRNEESARPKSFVPDCPSRLDCGTGEVPSIDIFDEIEEGSEEYLLTDIENWIEKDLDIWLSHCAGDENDCVAIFELAGEYHTRARRVYEGHAGWLSQMALNAVHLWFALDRMCCELYPLVEEFGPEIPPKFLDYLLLIHASDARRLHDIEKHIRDRWLDDNSDQLLSMFGALSDESFSVRYFKKDNAMKRLLKTIKTEAHAAEEEKRDELRDLMKTYNKKMADCDLLEHDHLNSRRRPKACEKCRAENEIKAMDIEVYENPLPNSKAQSNALCFELLCPPAIRYWRDLTVLIVRDLGREATPPTHTIRDQLSSYPPLENHYQGEPGRVGLVSTTQSWHHTHFHRQTLPVDRNKIILRHGLNWHLSYDKVHFTEGPVEPSLRGLCTLQLPVGPDQQLQTTLQHWTHTQNEVIATQNECPSGLLVHEYEAFASLRAGVLTQWLLLVKNLRASSLNMNASEVYMLYCQAAIQVAPNARDEICRDAHTWLNDTGFCTKLIESVAYVHDTIKANWNEVGAIRILVLLLMRNQHVTAFQKSGGSSSTITFAIY